MSVLVKGMEMPKNCWLCPLSVLHEIPREMLVCKITKEEVLRNKVDGSCPLVEIPPHGRLIDADAFNQKYGDWYTEEGSELGFIGALKYLVWDAPTVIEAEDGGT